MADIFISYKREDRAVAERLERALEQLGFDVWWDFELLSGDRFRKVIEKVIDQCGAAVVLWSTLSRESEFVLDEATYAKEQNKLCPARLDDCRLPMGFGQAQVADLRTWQGEISNPGFDELVRAIEQHTGKRAKLGARARTEAGEAKLEELDAFKAAEIAGSAPALKAFLKEFPSGQFGDFVRHQLAGLGEVVEPAPASTPSKPQPKRVAPPPAAEPLEAAAPAKATTSFFSGERRFMIIAGAALVVAAGAVAIALTGPPKPPQPPAPGVGVGVGTNVTATVGTGPLEQKVEPKQKTDIFDDLMLTPSHPYNLDTLDPNVRRAVEDARAAQVRAEEAAGRARASVAAAVDASAKATAKTPGFGALDTPVLHYTGTVQSNEATGAGVAVIKDGRFKGDSYSGEFQQGNRSGVGVYIFVERSDPNGPLTYEGEWRDDTMHGWGVYTWRGGEIYKGREVSGQRTGVAVYAMPDGSRYEGEYAANERDGYGVEWDPKGNPRNAGKWQSGALVQDLSHSN